MSGVTRKFNLPLFFRKLWHDFEMVELRSAYPNIDKTVTIGFGTRIFGNGKVFIGKNSRIGNNCILETDEGTIIDIGKKVLISHDVAIYTSNPITEQFFSSSNLTFRKGNVKIHDFCWIGKGVFIREGVEIGLNSVVGANSVVLNDVPDFTVVAGTPAKIRKQLRKDLKQ